MEQPIVVGTGHAGMVAVRQLVAAGLRPIVVDVARRLDPGREVAVRALGSVPPSQWRAGDLATVARPADGGRVPRRLAFGSSYPYADGDPVAPFRAGHDSAPVPSLAEGGFSTVWGAAMLPAETADLTGWPADATELERHYPAVLADLPFAATEDALAARFPLHARPTGQLVLPPAAAALLRSLEADPRLRGRSDVLVGRARLAVDADPTSPTGCRYCGRCASGCAYGSIQRTTDALEVYVAAGLVDHRPGRVVRTVEEGDGGVRVRCDLVDGGSEVIEGDAVFLAAGAMGSTRVLLESLGRFDDPVVLRSTQGAVVPLIQLRRHPAGASQHTLASLFVELKAPGSDRWVHVQINPANEVALERLGVERDGVRWRDRLAAPAVDRMLVAIVNLHSDLAGHHVLRLRRSSGGPPVLELEGAPNPAAGPAVGAAVGTLRRHLRRSGVAVLRPLVMSPTDPPSSWHVGGSLPMRTDPASELETDLLGRPAGWRRVHVIDSSVLPSVPATTLALVTMANAHRIVAAAVGPRS